MTPATTLVTIVGLTAVTVVTRNFFLLSEREWPMPSWLTRGLRYAPLAALAAIVAPEVLFSDGTFVATWQDARLLAVAAATVYFGWRRDILGTIVIGTAVLLAAKLGLGW